ncbi:50S ribosomal protein L29 [Candidatus Micrarchaeota archaeon]|nr:50S ribosomal protein L29 [Candidatus Micrarchaeota archaeon]
MKIKDIRVMTDKELNKKLSELDNALLEVNTNPAASRELKKAIARIKTVLNERKA